MKTRIKVFIHSLKLSSSQLKCNVILTCDAIKGLHLGVVVIKSPLITAGVHESIPGLRQVGVKV